MKIESLTANGTDEPLTITKISQGVKNPNRANIFINGKFDFSLDISQLADAKLKVGQIVTEPYLSELHSLSSFGKLYQRTLEWVLTRLRSEKETRDYLRRKLAADPDQIIQKLLAKNYLNDAKFTQYYIENRLIRKGISQKRLTQELRAKGISAELISQTLAATPRSDSTEIAKIIARKSKTYSDPQDLINYLIRQGFDYELSQMQVQQTDSQNSAQN